MKSIGIQEGKAALAIRAQRFPRTTTVSRSSDRLSHDIGRVEISTRDLRNSQSSLLMTRSSSGTENE